MKTPERSQGRRSGVFIVDFDQVRGTAWRLIGRVKREDLLCTVFNVIKRT